MLLLLLLLRMPPPDPASASASASESDAKPTTTPTTTTTTTPPRPPPWLPLLTAAALLLAFWATSSTLTFFNKWLFTHRGFRFPFLLVASTLSLQFAFAAAVRGVRARCLSLENETIPTHDWIKFVVPIGTFTALEIAASNFSLMLLSLTMHTMLKATQPLFVLAWLVGLGLERPSKRLAAVAVVFSLGAALLTLSSDSGSDLNANTESTKAKGESSVAGFLLMFLSSFCAGGRWALTQLMLGGPATNPHASKTSPTTLLYYWTPVGALSLVPFFLMTPQLKHFLVFSRTTASSPDLIGLIFVCTTLALTLLYIEYALISHPLVGSFVMVGANVVKEFILVAIGVSIQHDAVSPLGIGGFSLCLAALVAYRFRRKPPTTTPTTTRSLVNAPPPPTPASNPTRP